MSSRSNSSKPSDSESDSTIVRSEAYQSQVLFNKTVLAEVGYQSMLVSPPKSQAIDESYKIGDKIDDRYEVMAIHKGTMGVVYGTYDYQERLPRALKTLQKRFDNNKAMVDLFAKEAHVWVKLEKHPFIVRAYLVRTINDNPYIISEYIRGQEDMGSDLESWLGHPK